MWRDPSASIAQILEWLTDGATSTAQIIERSADLAGRWVAFVFSEGERIVFHDAWGSFGVYFGPDANDQFWISSSPKLISWSGLDRLDHEVVSQIVPSVVSDGSGGQYPCDVAPYLDIRALLPNHLLDLRDKSAKRHWPSRPLTQSQQDNPVEAAATQFAKIVKAFSVRQPLIFGLTGGTDSRLLTAAAEHVGYDYKSFTAASDGLTDDEKHFDIQIAEKIAAALGRENEIVHSSEQTAADAEPFLSRIHPCGTSICNAKRRHFCFGKTRSNCFFILGAARLIVGFRDIPDRDDPLLRDVLGCTECQGNTYARGILEPWFFDLKRIRKEFGYQEMNLVYWEPRLERWASESLGDYNLIQATLSPFSCRSWLKLALASTVLAAHL